MKEQKLVKERLVVLCDGIQSREDLARFAGTGVWVDSRLALTAPEDAEDADLVGAAVLTMAGAELGTVTEVNDFGAGPVLSIEREERTLELPFIANYFQAAGDELTLQLKVDEATFAELWVRK